MNVSLFQRGELLRISRIIGSLLSVIAGLVLIAQTLVTDLVPPPPGFGEAQAVVTNKYQRGTFMEPAFSLALTYEVVLPDTVPQQIRSALRVNYEDYYRLDAGDQIRIHYDMLNPYSWRLLNQKSGPREYAPGILLTLAGLLSLLFPMIISLASRQKDFEFTEEVEAH